MSDTWNFNLDEAPRGSYKFVTRVVSKTQKEVEQEVYDPTLIIAAGSEGVVTLSRWLPKEERWAMFTKDTPPIAWKPWPAHPEDEVE